MTTTTTRLDLLRAVLAAPDDDAPRLAFADWLEEQGETERAEFVRCQIEIARLRAMVQKWIHTPSNKPGGTAEDGGSAGSALADAQRLEGRERELLEAFSGIREGDKSYSNRAAWSMPFRAASPSRWWERVAFRRGFVAHITCTVAELITVADRVLWWPGAKCGACECHGWGQVGPNNQPRCPKCHNSLQNGIPHNSPHLRRCATCKTVWEPEACPACRGTGERQVTEGMMPIREVILQTWPEPGWELQGVGFTGMGYREAIISRLTTTYPCIPPEGWHLPGEV